MSSLDLLQRQLERLGLSPEAVPTLEQWRAFLVRVGASYQSADQDRYTLERSLDISSEELQELNRRLEQEAELARCAALAKSEFLATVSHELRTPMNGVIGMTEVLLSRAQLDPEIQSSLQIIRGSGEALMDIINDILDFSRLEAREIELEAVDFDPVQAVRDVLECLAVRADYKGLALQVEHDPELPASVRGDPGRLRQILMNLIGNAIKFTDTGGVTVRVGRRPTGDDDWLLHLTVTDTGIGIPTERLGSIFEAFVQGNASTTRTHGGTGLGLTICKRLVQLMGGEMEVTSEPGKGSCFGFTVSVEQPASSRQPRARVTSPTVPTPAGPAHEVDRREIPECRVLVVEDNIVNQKVASRQLAKLGAAVTVAANGREAVEILDHRDFDMVLMDCQMPVMDGYQATAAIRQREQQDDRPRVPIVALTANAMPGDREKCLAAGMDDYLAKPARTADIAQMVERWVRSGTGSGEPTSCSSPQLSG